MWKIIYKTDEQLNNLRESWKYLTELLYILYEKAQVGVTWIQLNQIAQDYIDKHNLKWSVNGYQGFPANLCFSVNECVVHGIPSNYVLKEWDLLKIDVDITYKWMITDACWSKIIWWNEHNQIGYELIKATKHATDAWVNSLEIWKSFYNMWKAVFNTMQKAWFAVIKDLCGHWVWTKVHEAPFILNYPSKNLKNIILKKWMAFTIEPITALKSTTFVEKEPGWWDLLCEKWDLWAQWEYTLIASDKWVEVIAWIQEDIFDNKEFK